MNYGSFGYDGGGAATGSGYLGSGSYDYGGGGGVSGGESQRPSNFRPGDWMCSCGAHNYAYRATCNKCSNPKPEGVGGGGGYRGRDSGYDRGGGGGDYGRGRGRDYSRSRSRDRYDDRDRRRNYSRSRSRSRDRGGYGGSGGGGYGGPGGGYGRQRKFHFFFNPAEWANKGQLGFQNSMRREISNTLYPFNTLILTSFFDHLESNRLKCLLRLPEG